MTDAAPKLARGWRRMRELRQQDNAARQEIIAGLVADLGRPATMRDQLAIEQIASLTVWARILERRGKFTEAAKTRDQITRTQRTNNIRPEKPAPAPRKSFREKIEERVANQEGAAQ